MGRASLWIVGALWVLGSACMVTGWACYNLGYEAACRDFRLVPVEVTRVKPPAGK